ncbi:hypothetical protein EV127DRAFT_92723 [Xylaria flabelliformis]|nr:hypothetical protein EV127DRAFT_92723 [Xylaria flabelliformis]
MATKPSGIYIHATDISSQFVAGVEKSWTVTTNVMSARELTFEDNLCTESITSFAFPCIGDHDEVARQKHRTLKPGGVAVATIWVFMPHVDAHDTLTGARVVKTDPCRPFPSKTSRKQT